MKIRELAVPDAYEISTTQHPDDRGVFLEYFKQGPLEEALGHPLSVVQGNCSVSKRGTVRGIHFAELPPSQAKYVTCMSGAVLDVVVDVRVGSPTFGAWDAVRLDDVDRRAAYISEGIGHAFVALTDGAVVSYLVSAGYAPGREHGITPVDPDLGIDWGLPVDQLLLSPKDTGAPTLAEAQAAGLLPDYAACRAFYDSLRAPSA